MDAQPQSERDLKRQMVKLDDVIEDMGGAKVRLVFFDACRDNPGDSQLHAWWNTRDGGSR